MSRDTEEIEKRFQKRDKAEERIRNILKKYPDGSIGGISVYIDPEIRGVERIIQLAVYEIYTYTQGKDNVSIEFEKYIKKLKEGNQKKINDDLTKLIDAVETVYKENKELMSIIRQHDIFSMGEENIKETQFEEAVDWLLFNDDNSKKYSEKAISDLKKAFYEFKKSEKTLEKPNEAHKILGIPEGALDKAILNLQEILDACKAMKEKRKKKTPAAKTILEKLDNLITLTGDTSLGLQIKKMELELKLAEPDQNFLQRLGNLFLKTLVSVAQWFSDASIRIKAFVENTDEYRDELLSYDSDDDISSSSSRKNSLE